MDSLRRSFKSPRHYRRTSSRGSFEHEERPILSDDADDRSTEFVVKIDGDLPNNAASSRSSDADDDNKRIWRESSYDFGKEGRVSSGRNFSFRKQAQDQQSGTPRPLPEIVEDPASRLIHSFLERERAAGGETSIDVDLEMDDFGRSPKAPSELRELRVSFVPSSESSSDDDESRGSVHRRGRAAVSPPGDYGGGEVIRCTSNSSFRRNSGLLRLKTRSRLMDPPLISPPADGIPLPFDDEKKSGCLPRKSGPLKSGLLAKLDDDDDDPFIDEDLPEDLKKQKYGTFGIIQLVSLLVILVALVCSLTVERFERTTVWRMHLWKWEVMVLALICGRLLSGWIIRIAVIITERNFLLRKKVLYFVYGVRNAVQNCLWLGLVLLVWHYMFDKKVERETRSSFLPKVNKILIWLLVATLVWLLKTLLVKILASSFHVSTYFDRIQEALFNQYVIETLSGPPLVEMQQNMEDEDCIFAEIQRLQNAGAKIPNDLKVAGMGTKSARASLNARAGVKKSEPLLGRSGRLSRKFSGKQPDTIPIDKLHKLNQKNVSAWNMKRLMKIVRHGTLTTLDEQLVGRYGEDESAVEIKSEVEAKIAAKKIFNNVSRPGSKYIYLPNLMRFMREDEAQKAMSLFEGANERGRVSKRCLKNWVVNVFRERRALALTLNDTKTAVNKLHQMANVLVAVIVLAIGLLILDIASSHFFVFLGSQIAVVIFVFGNTCKTTFEAIIFLFVMHPFDVGDRCDVNGVQLIVEEMNILTTIFLRWDNQKITYPNSVLATIPIGNFYRSPDMFDQMDFCVHVSTPLEKIATLKERILGYLDGRKDHWYPGTQIVLRDIEDMNRLKISIWFQHRLNWQHMGTRWDRRELLTGELIRILKELEIEYRMLPVEVNLRKLSAVKSERPPSNWLACNY